MIAAILKRTKTVLTALLLLLATTQVWALSYDSEALVVLGNKESTFDEKQEAIKALAKSQESYAVAVLKALMNSDLFYDKKAGTLYIETQNGSFISVLSNERYQGKKRNLKKVAINNSIREQLSLIISIADLPLLFAAPPVPPMLSRLLSNSFQFLSISVLPNIFLISFLAFVRASFHVAGPEDVLFMLFRFCRFFTHSFSSLSIFSISFRS